jgi:hypothetical protein
MRLGLSIGIEKINNLWHGSPLVQTSGTRTVPTRSDMFRPAVALSRPPGYLA